jgi:glutamate-1-semialdehyde 2,1-aminomutase
VSTTEQPMSDSWRQLEATYRARTNGSRELYERALSNLPGGDTRTGTFFVPYPTFMARGAGCRLWDVDGNEYIDCLSNFTSLVHGHAHPEVTRAITEQAARGTVHGAPVESQIALASAIRERLPSVETLRFTNSGTEAAMMAIRAARAFTGRPKILKMEGAYHGSYDAARVSVHPRLSEHVAPSWPLGEPDEVGLSPGAVAEVLIAPFNDLETTAAIVRRHRHELAAVIVEPMMGAAGMIPAERAFLAGLRDVTRETGVLLILDEVITLRLAWGGAQSIFSLTPDLTLLGKIIGGGLPIGAFGGRADIMAFYDPRRRDVITHSGTFNGNAVTMAAGLATLALLTPAAIERINLLGERLRSSLGAVLAAARIPATVTGLGSLSHVHMSDEPVVDYRSAARAADSAAVLLHLALMNHGVFAASRGMFITSTAMQDADVDQVVASYAEALREAGSALTQASVALPA